MNLGPRELVMRVDDMLGQFSLIQIVVILVLAALCFGVGEGSNHFAEIRTLRDAGINQGSSATTAIVNTEFLQNPWCMGNRTGKPTVVVASTSILSVSFNK